MWYIVKGKYLRGSEIKLDEEFDDLDKAKNFIQTKLLEDAALNVKVRYRIYDFNEVVVQEYDPSTMNLLSLQQAAQGTSGNSSTVRPTPFDTTPRPSGSPQKWLVGEQNNKKNQKKDNNNL